MSTALILLSQAYSLAWLPTVPMPVGVAAAAMGWLILSVAVGGWVGRMVRRRDRQKPDVVDVAYEEAVEASKVRAKQLFLEHPRSREQELAAWDRYVASEDMKDTR